MAPVYNIIADNEDVLSGTESMAVIGLLYPRKSQALRGMNDTEFRGVMELLGHTHECYDVIDPIVTEKVNRYKMLVLPDAAFLSDDEIAVIKKYVKAGGHLIVSGECASITEKSPELSDSKLAEVLGCNLKSRIDDFIPMNGGGAKSKRRCYFNIIDTSHPVLEQFEECRWQPKSFHYLDVELTTGKMLANTVTAPTILPANQGPDGTVDIASIIENIYGDGKVLYLPWDVGEVYLLNEPKGILDLYRAGIKWMLGDEAIVTTFFHRNMEFVLRSKDDKRIFHIIDYTGPEKVLAEPGQSSVAGKIRIPGGEKVKSIRALDGAEMEWQQLASGEIEFKVDIDRWQAVVMSV
jgi:hypothetical protein